MRDDRERQIWDWGIHEDNLFDSRLQVFLTAHAILIMAAGFAVQKEHPSQKFLLLLSVLGLVTSLAWVVVQFQSHLIVQRLEREFEQHTPLFRDVFDELEARHPRLFRWERNRVMTWTLPPLVLIWWGCFLAFVLFNAFEGRSG